MKSQSCLYTFALAVLVAISGFTSVTQAQDARTDATMAYNGAIELAQQREFLDAIEMYREALELASAPECEDCSDIVERVEGQLPRVYFSRAGAAFEEFRSQRSPEIADQAIAYFEEAAAAGEEFGDQQVSERSRAVIPQIYYNKSLVEYNAEDYEAAHQSLDRAIELNANYLLPYYQKALVLNAQGAPVNEVLEWLDRAIEVGERTGDSQNVARAKSRAADELIYEAVQSINEESFGQAQQYLTRAESYEPQNPTLHYRFAELHNNRGQYSQAVERANQALELESGGVADRAKIYFELGVAYKGLEQQSNACSAFEDAAYGDFRDPALHELEYELECEGYAAAGSRRR